MDYADAKCILLEDRGNEEDKYNTKFDSVKVCNACYAIVLGYS